MSNHSTSLTDAADANSIPSRPLPPDSSTSAVTPSMPNGTVNGSAGIPQAAVDFAARLFDGARKGDTALFEQVLGYNPGVRDLRNDKGDTLLMLATYHGHLPLTLLLLSHGANPNILNDRQQSPLAGAIFKGEKEVVEALLDNGADPDIGEPSAKEAVKIFRQEEVWGERLGMRPA